MRTGADALVAALEAHGVEIVFGIPGQHALSLWEALRGSSIRPVVVRHEQAAAFAAVGYARTSDRLGVCITSTGPGAFNAFAGMGEADASNLRVLHITTQVPSDAGERGWMHETVGQSSAFHAVTRHHLRPRTPAALAAAVDEALCAIACRPGPAMIEAMTTVLTAPAEPAGIAVTRLALPAPDPAAIGRVRELLDGAQAPLVFAGGGARLHAARVAELAEALDAPVVTSFNGKGVLPPGHALHAGSSCEEPSIRRLVATSDVCVALGTRFSEEPTCHWAVEYPARARPGRPRPVPHRPQLPRRRGDRRRRRPLLRRPARGRRHRRRPRRRRRRPCRAGRPPVGGGRPRLRRRARADAPARRGPPRRRAGDRRHDHPVLLGRALPGRPAPRRLRLPDERRPRLRPAHRPRRRRRQPRRAGRCPCRRRRLPDGWP